MLFINIAVSFRFGLESDSIPQLNDSRSHWLSYSRWWSTTSLWWCRAAGWSSSCWNPCTVIQRIHIRRVRKTYFGSDMIVKILCQSLLSQVGYAGSELKSAETLMTSLLFWSTDRPPCLTPRCRKMWLVIDLSDAFCSPSHFKMVDYFRVLSE